METGKRKTGKQQSALVGVAWYRSNQWDRLKEVSEDRAKLEETWEEWVRIAEKSLRDFRARGIQVGKVEVDVEELIQWCRSKQQPIHAASRAAFAAEKLHAGTNTKVS